MNELSLIQFVFLFGLSVIFSMVSLTRESIVSYLLTGILWFATAIISFLANPTESVSMVLGYIFILLGMLFSLATINALGDLLHDRKTKRWRVDGL